MADEKQEKSRFVTVDDYFASIPKEKASGLKLLRKTIKAAAPTAEEVISYNMPAFRFHGMLVFYAVFTKHIGFFPGSSAINTVFKEELVNYKTSKGTIQFPLGIPIPVDLVKRIIHFRMQENLAKEEARKTKRK